MNILKHGRRVLATTVISGMAVAAALVSTPAWASYQIADRVTLGAKFFADVTHSEDDIDSGFHLKRSYITLKAKVDKRTKLRVTLDQRNEEQAGDKGGVFVKYAYIDYVLDGNSFTRIGLLNTPYVGYDEANLWGYRHVAPSFTDYWKAQTSADLGASVSGSLGDGYIEYQFSALNGEGYGNKVDGTGFAAAGRINVNLGRLTVGGYFHDERSRNGQTVKDYDPSRQGLFAAYRYRGFRLSGQYMSADDGNAAVVYDSGVGYNVQGNAPLSADGKWHLFGRYDEVDKRGDGNQERLWMMGVSAKASKALTLSPYLMVVDKTNVAPQTTISLSAQLKL